MASLLKLHARSAGLLLQNANGFRNVTNDYFYFRFTGLSTGIFCLPTLRRYELDRSAFSTRIKLPWAEPHFQLQASGSRRAPAHQIARTQSEHFPRQRNV